MSASIQLLKVHTFFVGVACLFACAFASASDRSNTDKTSEAEKELAKMEAQINARINEEIKRELTRIKITPNTTDRNLLMYYRKTAGKIEKTGTFNFPVSNGKKLYGSGVVYVPIFRDGSIYEKDGGPRIAKSFGDATLDRAMLRIIRRAAPFDRCPPDSSDASATSISSVDVCELIFPFSFARLNDDGSAAESMKSEAGINNSTLPAQNE